MDDETQSKQGNQTLKCSVDWARHCHLLGWHLKDLAPCCLLWAGLASKEHLCWWLRALSSQINHDKRTCPSVGDLLYPRHVNGHPCCAVPRCICLSYGIIWAPLERFFSDHLWCHPVSGHGQKAHKSSPERPSYAQLNFINTIEQVVFRCEKAVLLTLDVMGWWLP